MCSYVLKPEEPPLRIPGAVLGLTLLGRYPGSASAFRLPSLHAGSMAIGQVRPSCCFAEDR
jgi:hypothetical protein